MKWLEETLPETQHRLRSWKHLSICLKVGVFCCLKCHLYPDHGISGTFQHSSHLMEWFYRGRTWDYILAALVYPLCCRLGRSHWAQLWGIFLGFILSDQLVTSFNFLWLPYWLCFKSRIFLLTCPVFSVYSRSIHCIHYVSEL